MPSPEWFKENPKVSTYISRDLNQRLENWMREKNIKKVSQALTAILEEYLGVVQSNSKVVQYSVDTNRIEVLEERVNSIHLLLNQLQGAVADMQKNSGSKVIQSSIPGQLSILEPVPGNLVAQSSSKKTEVWTTPEVTSKLGLSRSQLDRLKSQDKLPHTVKGHTILRWSGKQPKPPFGNLWEIQEA